MFLNEGQLGQPPKGGDPNAWGAYVAALRDKVAGKKSDVVQAYNTLKKVREQVGLPFMGGAAGEGGAPDTGAWAPDLEQQAVDIMAMGTLCVSALGDVLAKKRRLMWDDMRNDFAVEGLPGDVVRLQVDGANNPVLVDSSGQVTHVTGQVGEPVTLIFGVAVALAVIQTVALVVIVWKALDALETVVVQKTERTAAETAKKYADLVEQGKLTPAQAKGLTDAVYTGAKGLREEERKKKDVDKDWQDTLKTLGYVALGVGILYVIVKYIPAPAPRSAAALPLAGNPRREEADTHAATELELYIENDARFSMHGQGQGRAISQNLWRKWKKGTYDSARAPQAWSYVVESAAKAYAKEFGGTWSRTFNPATRDLVATSLARQWESEARSGEFDRYPPAAA